jgi:hypothetical protein
MLSAFSNKNAMDMHAELETPLRERALALSAFCGLGFDENIPPTPFDNDHQDDDDDGPRSDSLDLTS